MQELLFWIYLVNLVFMINHEIDSGYWKEWNLVGAPIGISGFLLLHFPLLFIFLYGVALLPQGASGGYYISLALAGLGLFAPCVHAYFLWKGRPEFKAAMSIFILAVMFPLSAVQLAITLWLMEAV